MPDPRSSDALAPDPLARLRESMIHSIGSRTAGLTDWRSPIANLTFFRRERPMPPCICLVEPSIILVVQGEKQMLVGGEAYPYDIHRFLITSLDLPANSQVMRASADQPCLGLALKLDLRVMAELIAQGGLPLPAERSQDKAGGVGLGAVTPPLLESFKRLLDLLDDPAAIPVLAPLIEREIHYRLLRGEQAPRLWQIAAVGSQGHRIARAIDWLKLNYTRTLRIEDLAAHVQMSTSSLHQHFRQLTAMSPLQYQKWLRLNEARRLMLNAHRDAASAAFEVGYESPSQFSREYARLFGAPPKRDIETLRSHAATGRHEQGIPSA
ncbi:AraC family transcriptional regulator [Chromobacterium paludis]|uniref:AraC family transcriptional regulator n=1 Tax=Chromobacterium paludis TaxID=2605945 RepID=A0A5C1DHU6_9NEIS|nr:AraC family transcriptional regulator [Chromobacterium paludis]QEL55577.1 AraC family transcriptional regulator [Chromobacterium paludis]